MAKTIKRPSGLELTQIDERTIEWAYPPSGTNAKGQIARRGSSGNVWSLSNAGSISEGRTRISTPNQTLERSIGILEREIESVEGLKREAAAERQRKIDEEVAKARQLQEEEQQLQEYMADLFK